MQQIATSQELDQHFFWYTVNRNKQVHSATPPIKDNSVVLLTNPDDIRSEWTNNYQNLFMLDENECFDERFKIGIGNKVREIR